MQTQNAELTQVMNETFTGHRVVKAYNLESTVVEQFRAATRQFNSHYMRIVRAAETPSPLAQASPRLDQHRARPPLSRLFHRRQAEHDGFHRAGRQHLPDVSAHEKISPGCKARSSRPAPPAAAHL